MDGVTVSAPTRLHLTLCDLGRATLRAYGGVGFAIAEPLLETRVRVGSGNIVLPDGSDEAAFDAVVSVIKDLEKRTGGSLIDVDVVRMPAQHSGLGTKTALLLSVVFGANELLTLGLSINDMQLLSGRGGTSGVGVHSFFTGGMIWDAGHRQADIKQFGPSRYHRPETIPPSLARLNMPEAWEVCLLEVEGARRSGDEEITLFSKATPVPAYETLRLLGWVTHGLLPAVAEQDLAQLATSLEAISRTGFKAREVAEQSAGVQSLLCDLQAQSIPAGMSSLGPTIFAVASGGDSVIQERINATGKRHGAKCFWTRAANQGAVVSVVR
jgi:beta-ribofuranosylaminobenzene 5'-phosphate synthase